MIHARSPFPFIIGFVTDQPLSWHFGLMAERCAKFITATPQLDYLRSQIDHFGQPVLDVACGTGRLLLPLLRMGIDIDGVDLSEDMLAHPRAVTEVEGLANLLAVQPMHDFHLPRRYRTIYICDSFGLAGSRRNDLETLRRCYEHLEEGGALVVNIEAEYRHADSWKEWLKEYRDTLPEPWPEPSTSQTAPDGSQYFSQFRMLEINPLELYFIRQVRMQKWTGGELVASQESSLRGNFYFKPELYLMLQVAGFRDIQVTGDFTGQPATPDSGELVFTAIR
jgi:SAM-dependent methyltransferase